MSKFNRNTAPVTRASRGSTPLTSTSTATLTHEGGAAVVQDPRAELYRLTLAGFVAEDSFYESGADKMARVRRLVTQIVEADTSENRAESGRWLAGLIGWMRNSGNMRTAPMLTAVEAVRVRLAVGGHSYNREMVSGALARADEPGEFLAYWLSQSDPRKGKTVPNPVKRGLADAAVRLYDEFATLRYDTASHGVRFGDVVEIAQPRTNARAGTEQNDALMRHLIDRRHAYNTSDIPESLTMLRTRAELEALPVAERRPLVEAAERNEHDAFVRLRRAGMTWEWLASWLQGPMDAVAWKVALSSIGYMAALRNLRNLDQAGIDDATAQVLADRLADPAQVAKSRQFPFRFLSAYGAVDSDRWRVALGKALDASTANIPALPGRTLILIDTSASMDSVGWSERSKMTPARTAALFGIALGMRCGTENVDVYGWADGQFRHDLRKGASVLREIDRFTAKIGSVGHGTRMTEAVRATFRPGEHSRVVLLTDMQTFGSYYGAPADQVPVDVPFYAFDLSGYKGSVVPDAPNRHQLGSLTDATFRWIPMVESGNAVRYPWEADD